MPISINDFKEGGPLRRFVTQVGLLDKIGAADVDQEKLLAALMTGVTNVGTYVDSNNDGIIDENDSINPDYEGGEPTPGPTPGPDPEPQPVEVETIINNFDLVASDRSWKLAYNNGNGPLAKYYEDHPEEDLWNKKENRAVNFNDRWYTGTIDGQEVSCGTEWAANNVQKIVVNETTYFMPIWGYDLNPHTAELFTNVELTESANKTFEIATVSFSADCVHCWEGTLNAPEAKLPWIIISPEIPTEGKYKVECSKAGENAVWPWGETYKTFSKGYAICSIPGEFNNTDVKIDPATGKASVKVNKGDVTITLYHMEVPEQTEQPVEQTEQTETVEQTNTEVEAPSVAPQE